MGNSIRKTAYNAQEIYAKFYTETHQGAYAAYLRGKRIRSEEDYLREFSAAFQFPWYYGENWNALDECASDLDWLSFTHLLVIIDNYSDMFQGNEKAEELREVVERHLRYMVDDWESEGVNIEVWLNQ